MCGIAGFIRSCSPGINEKTLHRMGEAIAHRGPDACGEYLDEYVGLAHRRLSIIDLSIQGNQPMITADGRYVIVFNGEIYNFQELRNDLEKKGHSFQSRTDTEVILALYALEGRDCLAKLNGMFAFAIWDKKASKLFLARDRVGKKPLYYYYGGVDRFAFASEIKSILALHDTPREIEPTAIADYLKYLYIPAPKTIFKHIYKLPAAHYLELQLGEEPKISEYWDLDFSKRTANTSLDDSADELHELIKNCTTSRMISDVPLGAFLSGGIDSSVVVAMMAGSSAERVKTCSIGFTDKSHDESAFARQIAQMFNADHSAYTVGNNLADTVTALYSYFDEPFADSSAIPTFHVSRLARQKVTVALSGDGGDETFGGYEKYTTDLRENLIRKIVPRPVLRTMHKLSAGRSGDLMRKAQTLSQGALDDPGRGFYRTNTFVSDSRLEKILSTHILSECAGYDPAEHTLRYWDKMRGADHVSCMLYTDIKTYLPGDILTKVDRMSMANSLEVRAPLLDYRVMEFAASLPSHWKIAGNRKKQILKKAFSDLLPQNILNRRKHGFTVPLDDWFRKDLYQLAYDSLFMQPAMGQYFSMEEVRNIWQEHQERDENHGTLLWSLFSFALWHKEYMRV